jgi:hypothetical protein
MNASIKRGTKLSNSRDCPAQPREPIAIVGMACRYPGDALNAVFRSVPSTCSRLSLRVLNTHR